KVHSPDRSIANLVIVGCGQRGLGDGRPNCPEQQDLDDECECELAEVGSARRSSHDHGQQDARDTPERRSNECKSNAAASTYSAKCLTDLHCRSGLTAAISSASARQTNSISVSVSVGNVGRLIPSAE